MTDVSTWQTKDIEEVPIASEDEGSMECSQEQKERQQRVSYRSLSFPSARRPMFARQPVVDDLPPSSPIETESEGGDVEVQGRCASKREATATSYTSQEMWSAAGSIPATFLFDEHEASGREDGEVDDPTLRQEADEDDDEDDGGPGGDAHRERIGRFEDFLGKHTPVNGSSGYVTTPRKRSYAFSPVSEERNRAARKPRREEVEEDEEERGAGVRLPSIQELVGNPWRGHGSERTGSRRVYAPVHMSTLSREQQPPLLNMTYQSGANVSGKAPTPFSVGTVAPDARSNANGEAAGERAGTHYARSASRATSRTNPRLDGMDLDGRDDVEEDLLEARDLRRARIERNRRELEEIEERRLALQKALMDSEDEENRGRLPIPRSQWQGGYAPEMMRHGLREERRGRPAGRAVDDFDVRRQHRGTAAQNDEDEELREMDRASREKWSAIPNTKAWLYREERRAREQRGRAEGWAPPISEDRQDSPRAMVEDERTSRRGTEERSEARLSLRDRGRSREERDSQIWEERAVPEAWSPRHGQAYDDRLEQGPMTHGYGRAEGRESTPGRWPGMNESGAIPTAVARDAGAADTPVTVDDPHHDRWTIHFDDPEALLKGQSSDFIRVVWWGTEPTVIFTVYNYKYTKNDAISRHIEASVTSMTTVLTGETDFKVIPPDPEWRHQLQPRDLPFTWAIRGLSEAGAWEMVKARIITTKGVTILTHPRTLCNPRWVCGLVGFVRPDTEAIKKTVLTTLRSEYMIGRLTDMTRSNAMLRHIPEERRVAHILRSIEVRIAATGDGGYVSNIYITPPTDDMDIWREWAEELRSCRFNAFLCGAGVARRVFWCAGCRGVDHETENCTIPTMRGWKGPEAGTATHTRLQIAATARGGLGRGRGGMARGASRAGGSAGRIDGDPDYGEWRGQQPAGRGLAANGRGYGRGTVMARGARGAKRANWSTAMRP